MSRLAAATATAAFVLTGFLAPLSAQVAGKPGSAPPPATQPAPLAQGLAGGEAVAFLGIGLTLPPGFVLGYEYLGRMGWARQNEARSMGTSVEIFALGEEQRAQALDARSVAVQMSAIDRFDLPGLGGFTRMDYAGEFRGQQNFVTTVIPDQPWPHQLGRHENPVWICVEIRHVDVESATAHAITEAIVESMRAAP